MHWMYVLLCADGTLYTGYTTDVARRLAVHQAGKGARYTRSRLPVRLLAGWAYDSKRAAMAAEWHFKRLSRERKLALLVATAGQTSGPPLP
ncbi:MAG: GIY-YIG nuclease family protein [Candidatus Sericytochromatia bacterium]|nr:GIY-YIG nuclease family protein [Candidatus Sericytochromatia bacterium]